LKSWDEQLEDMREKYRPGKSWGQIMNPVKPDIKYPDVPFLLVLYRIKISYRNPQYLAVLPVWEIDGLPGKLHNLKHKGWGKIAIMFTVPDWIKQDPTAPRWNWWKVKDWNGMKHFVSEGEAYFLPVLEKYYPTPIVIAKDKKGQFKLLM
jgi:hypothetical protein